MNTPELEVWKDIPGYEGLYQASNLGRIKSLGRNVAQRVTKDQILQPALSKGYLRVRLSKNSINKMWFVHKAVACCFVPNPNCLQEINHKKGNKLDNRATELEWCTQIYNNHHSRTVLNSPGGRRTPVIDLATGIFYDSAKEAHVAKDYKHSLAYTHMMLRGDAFNKTCLKIA